MTALLEQGQDQGAVGTTVRCDLRFGCTAPAEKLHRWLEHAETLVGRLARRQGNEVLLLQLHSDGLPTFLSISRGEICFAASSEAGDIEAQVTACRRGIELLGSLADEIRGNWRAKEDYFRSDLGVDTEMLTRDNHGELKDGMSLRQVFNIWYPEL